MQSEIQNKPITDLMRLHRNRPSLEKSVKIVLLVKKMALLNSVETVSQIWIEKLLIENISLLSAWKLHCCINEKGNLPYPAECTVTMVYHFVCGERDFFKSYILLTDLADIAASRGFQTLNESRPPSHTQFASARIIGGD